MESSAPRAPRRRERPKRRPERQQIMLRRGLALGGGLILLILVVLGVKGCLDARANRELSDYARNVTQIVEETDQTSKTFFAKFEDPGNLTVTDFVNEVQADRSAMDNYSSRIDGLNAPGDMDRAQRNLELVYELRSSAMEQIAGKMSTALGNAGATKAIASITKQMQKLLASDVVYENVVRPEINGVLEANGIEGSEVPKSKFLPDGTEWLEESRIAEALGSVSGSSTGGAAAPGVHGLGLVGVSVNGTPLEEGTTIELAPEETPEVEVEVENQGESPENGVTVSVSVDGGNTLKGEISNIEAGAAETVTIPLTPAPSDTVTLEVKVETVPGEEFSQNNEASYTITIE